MKRVNDEKTAKNDTAMTPPVEQKSKRVWIIHGRNVELVKNISIFLRAIGLDPIGWEEARARTGVSSPHIDEILKAGFDYAQAFVVLLTGDDEAKLRKEYIKGDDPEHERTLTPQARQNVVFEAGMAFGLATDRVVFVQQGIIRPFSNISGRHLLNLDNTAEKRRDFVSRLKSAGCDLFNNLIDRNDWLTAGDFEKSIPSDQVPSSTVKRSEVKSAIESIVPDMPFQAKVLLKRASKKSGKIIRQNPGIQITGWDSIDYSFLEPEERAKWNHAIDVLKKRKLIEDENDKGEVFEVTHEGFETAKKIPWEEATI